MASATPCELTRLTSGALGTVFMMNNDNVDRNGSFVAS
jgi:hypothetical protein